MLYTYFDMQSAALGPMRAMTQLTKTYFNNKPEAWSVDKKASLV